MKSGDYEQKARWSTPSRALAWEYTDTCIPWNLSIWNVTPISRFLLIFSNYFFTKNTVFLYSGSTRALDFT